MSFPQRQSGQGFNFNTHFHPAPISRTTYGQAQSYFFLMSSVLRSISSYIYIFPASRVLWTYFVDDFNVSYLQQNFYLRQIPGLTERSESELQKITFEALILPLRS
jgi:hypothetical protein